MDIRTIEKHYTKHRRNRAILISLAVHGILVFGTALWLLKPLIEVEKDTIAVDFVVPPERIHIPKKVVSPVEKSQTAAAAQSQAAKLLSGTMSPIPRVDNTTRLEPPSLSTDADLIPSPESILGKSPTIRRGSGATEDGRGTGRSEIGTGLGSRGTGKGGGGLGNLTQGSGTGQDAFGGEGVSDIVGAYKDEIGGELDSILEEDGGVVRGHIRLIRLKHDMSDWWQDPTAIPSLIKWLQEHVKTISADMDYEGGALPLTDKRIMRAPLIIMTGHDQAMSVSYRQIADRNSQTSGFSESERAALREYILEHNGLLFFDYCGDGGNEKSFARLVENELRAVFP